MRERLVKRNVKYKTLQPIYMKNFIQWFIGIFVLIASFIGCQATNDETGKITISAEERKLNLQAPNGEYLAGGDLVRLKKMLAPCIGTIEKDSVVYDFEILSIQYDSLPYGLIADIEFVTKSGYHNHLVMEYEGKEESLSSTDD